MPSIRKLLCCCAIAAAFAAGCSDQRAVPGERFAEGSEPPPAPACPATCSPLPEGVELDFNTHLAADFYYVNKKKAIRRRVVLRYAPPTRQMQPALEAAMTAAGFRLFDVRNRSDGSIHIRFEKKGYGMAHALIRPQNDANLETFQGQILFDLPPRQINLPPAGTQLDL